MGFTVNFAAVNLLVVFGAAVAGMLWGALWYSPLLAGPKWQELGQVEASAAGVANAPSTFTAAFVLQVLAASLLAGLLGPVASGMEGLQLGSLIGLCIVMPAVGTINLFEKRSTLLAGIHLVYQIGALSLMGFIIGRWS